jgi:phage gpG-like protein
MITVTIDTSGLTRKLADFPEALARAQRVALLKIGNIVKTHAREAIKKPALRPSPWAPRKKDYPHPPLLKTTNMWNSITSKVTAPDTVVVGTPHKYAIYHQFGTKNMPARPFFPIDERGQLTPTVQRDIKDNVEAIYKKEIDKVFGNGGGG